MKQQKHEYLVQLKEKLEKLLQYDVSAAEYQLECVEELIVKPKTNRTTAKISKTVAKH